MISPSQSILLEAIKASVFGIDPNYTEGTNWDDVLSEAKAQTVMGLVAPVVPVNDESSKQCKAYFMRNLFEQDRLVKLFDSCGIPFVILKGSAAAIYYPKPYLRTMGDIDILVAKDRFINAIELLESNGYNYVYGKADNDSITEEIREIEFTKNGVVVELHQRFSSPGVNFDDILDEAICRREYRILYQYRFPILPEVENGLVLIGHINQHLKNNGIGLRQIIDWEMYLHSISNVAVWEKNFIPLVEKVGLLTLAAYVTRLCNKFLGLTESLSICNNIDDNILDEFLDIILTDGNFGRRESSTETLDEKRMRGAFYSIKRYGFFKYFTDVGFSKCRIKKKHALLIPIAFFYGLFKQLKMGIKTSYRNKGFVMQMNDGNRRFELYKKLGVRNGNE